MKMKSRRAPSVFLIAMIVLAALIAGCSALQSKENAAAPAAEAPRASAAVQNAPVYYDFGDVMLPRELKVNKKDSFVMNSGGITSGVLVLNGGVDAASLVSFFENKMPVDGWRQKGSFRSAQSIMLFEKQNRWCVILIEDGRFGTQVEIWVAPNSQGMLGATN